MSATYNLASVAARMRAGGDAPSWADSLWLVELAEAQHAACEMALNEWFDLHYGSNDVGMAALIRDRLRAAIAKAGGR